MNLEYIYNNEAREENCNKHFAYWVFFILLLSSADMFLISTILKNDLQEHYHNPSHPTVFPTFCLPTIKHFKKMRVLILYYFNFYLFMLLCINEYYIYYKFYLNTHVASQYPLANEGKET